MFKEKCHRYFVEFLSCVTGDVSQYASLRKSLILPVIPVSFVTELANKVTEILKEEPTLLVLQSPITVIGDLHGHILDLFRILKSCGSPQTHQFLFLGDLVDRGEFSVETVILVYLMKVVWPENVFIIRGNHEFQYMSGQCGFFDQLFATYNESDVFSAFIKSFSFLPLGAVIDAVALCIHAGLSPELTSLQQIEEIERPFDYFGDNPVIDGILWSDPSLDIPGYDLSPRGAGYLYGEESVKDFLQHNNLKFIIRGHECVQNGLEVAFGSVLTVFSASNYCGVVNNDAAYINWHKENENGFYDKKLLPSIRYLLRGYVTFNKEKVESQSNVPRSARTIVKPMRGTPIPTNKGKTPRIPKIKNKRTRFNSKIQKSCILKPLPAF